MKLNFSFQKAFTDLFSDKKHVIALFWIAVGFTVFDIVTSKLGNYSSFNVVNILLAGYISIMANNIILGQEPVLANIFSNTNKNKNLLLVGFKASVVNIIYYSLPIFTGFFIVKLLSADLNSKAIIELSSIVIITLLLTIFASVSSFTLFSENLSFKQSFNILKSIKSFKYSWGEYLISGIFYVFVLAGSYSILLPFEFLFHKIIIISGIVKLTMHLLVILAAYFSNHLTAQAYKYALSNMKD